MFLRFRLLLAGLVVAPLGALPAADAQTRERRPEPRPDRDSVEVYEIRRERRTTGDPGEDVVIVRRGRDTTVARAEVRPERVRRWLRRAEAMADSLTRDLPFRVFVGDSTGTDTLRVRRRSWTSSADGPRFRFFEGRPGDSVRVFRRGGPPERFLEEGPGRFRLERRAPGDAPVRFFLEGEDGHEATVRLRRPGDGGTVIIERERIAPGAPDGEGRVRFRRGAPGAHVFEFRREGPDGAPVVLRDGRRLDGADVRVERDADGGLHIYVPPAKADAPANDRPTRSRRR